MLDAVRRRVPAADVRHAVLPDLPFSDGCFDAAVGNFVFRSRHAYARHNGTAPLPVWSGNRERHRLSRVGNRQRNAAVHRIAITKARYHPDARQYLQQRRDNGDTKTESLRALKRRLSDVIYRALLADA